MRRRAHRPRPEGPDRAKKLLAWLSILCLAGQGTGLAHLAFGTHEICAEHGELIEARAQRSPPFRLQGGQPETAQLAASGLVSPADDHDHCAVAAHQRQPFWRTQAASGPVRTAVARTVALRP